MDFYTYSTRKLAQTKNVEKKRIIIKRHAIVIMLLVIFLLPLLTILNNPFSGTYHLIFTGIFLTELVLIDLYRMFTMNQHPVYSSLIFLGRQALWPCVTIFFIILLQYDLALIEILYIWLACNLGLILITLFASKSFWLGSFEKPEISSAITWVKKGLLFSAPMYLAAIAGRGLFYLDKILVFEFDNENLAIYGLFFSISTLNLALVDSMVIAHHLPKMIANKVQDFENSIKKLTHDLIKVLVSCNIVVLLVTPIVIRVIDKAEYSNHLEILYFLLIASSLISISKIFQCKAYALGNTKQIFSVNFAALLSFLILTLIYQEHSAQNISIFMIVSSFLLVALYPIFERIRS